MSTTTRLPKPKRRWCRFSLLTLLVVVTLFVVLLGGGFATWRFVVESPPDQNADSGSGGQAGSPPLDEQRVAAAREALESAVISFENGTGTDEKVYQWSRRLMESITDAPNCTATERLKAIEEHLGRMRQLEKRHIAGRLNYIQVTSPSEVRYYVVEAEFWLQEARENN